MNPFRNWTKYREVLSKARGPVLPYLGVFLKDLWVIGWPITDLLRTFVEDGNSDYVDDGKINFDKVILMGELLARIEAYQNSDYLTDLTLNNVAVIKFLRTLPEYTEDDFEMM